jgi:hypothetical protein
MKINEIICETVVTKKKLADGVLALSDHYIGRVNQRLQPNDERVINLYANAKSSEFIKNELAALPNEAAFALYNSDYFGLGMVKKIKREGVLYVLTTASETMYPLEKQKLYMVDDNPRKFKNPDYNNMPLDMKRYMLEMWSKTNFSKIEKREIAAELEKQGHTLKIAG